MTGPANEMAASLGRFRASQADRERVVDSLKTAFVLGRLTAAELDARVGRALTARTYADLAAAQIPAPAAQVSGPVAQVSAPVPACAPAPRRRPVRAGTVMTGIAAVAAVAAGGQPGAAVLILVVVITIFAAVATAFVATAIDAAAEVRARRRNRALPRGGPANR